MRQEQATTIGQTCSTMEQKSTGITINLTIHESNNSLLSTINLNSFWIFPMKHMQGVQVRVW